MRKQGSTPTPDERLAGLAAREHGVLDTRELLACGLTHSGINRRVSAGRLHRLHRGVYAVGHAAIGHAGRWIAAVKACGAAAVLSHQSAGVFWGLLDRYVGPVHVTIPAGRKLRPQRGITVHRSRTLARRDTTRMHGIAVTTPIRTLLDLRRVLPREEWEAALDRARARGIDTSAVTDEAPTRSALERKFLRLCRRHRIPTPRVNVRVGRFLADFLWAESRLIVEVDGYEFHRGRDSFEADRARDAELAVAGYRVLRFTYRQVTEAAVTVAATIRELLDR